MKTIELAGASWITENLKDNEGNQLFTYDMLKGDQTDTFIKNEKIRKEIHEK